ncbi:MAG: hypothetical protein K9L82_18760, partial [Chromatiaceae bacterium]|nr:hypothetical protein [Chromatiaceae bacterium]
MSPQALSNNLSDGRAKLYLIRRALLLREQMPDLFAHGEYSPLTVEGPHAHRLCAFSRSHQGQSVVVIAPRLLAGLSELAVTDDDDIDPLQDPGWDETWISIPAARLDDVLGGTDSSAESRPENNPGSGLGKAPETSTECSINVEPNRQLETEQHQSRQALRASTILRRFPVGLLKTSAL